MLGLGGTTPHVDTFSVYPFPEQRVIHELQRKKLICAIGISAYPSPAGWGARSCVILKATQVVPASNQTLSEVTGV